MKGSKSKNKGVLVIHNVKDVSVYSGGGLLIEACPGVGKTTFLVHLASEWMDRFKDKRVAFLTYTNAAAQVATDRLIALTMSKHNFDRNSAAAFVSDMAWIGTIHSFARYILDYLAPVNNMRLVFQVADEQRADDILVSAFEAVSSENYQLLREATAEIAQAMDIGLDNALGRLRLERLWLHHPRVFSSLKRSMQALTLGRIERTDESSVLLFIRKIHERYISELDENALITPEQLIAEAIDAMRANKKKMDSFINQWSCILEDEAQDSTREQVKMLAMIASRIKNWVRVGDNNQSIMGTFTLSSSRALGREGIRFRFARAIMPYSPRSTREIIDVANALANYAATAHPVPEVRSGSLQAAPFIRPSPDGGNPDPLSPELPSVVVYRIKSEQGERDEFNGIIDWLRLIFETKPDARVGILVRTNLIGFNFANYISNLPQQVARGLQARLKFDLRSDIDLLQLSQRLGILMQLGKVNLSSKEIEDAALVLGLLVDGANILRFISNQDDKVTLSADEEKIVSMIKEFRILSGALLEDYALCVLNRCFPEHKNYYGAIYSILQRHRHHRSFVSLSSVKGVLADQSIGLFLPRGETDKGEMLKAGQALVTTFHKAKGQEFDAVAILPASERSFPMYPDAKPVQTLEDAISIYLDSIEKIARGEDPKRAVQATRVESVQEGVRLLYVCLTRARQHVAMVVNPPLRQSGDDYHLDRLTRLMGTILAIEQTSLLTKHGSMYQCNAKPEWLPGEKREKGERGRRRRRSNLRASTCVGEKREKGERGRRILNALGEGKSAREIAKLVGVSVSTVHYWKAKLAKGYREQGMSK